MPICGFFPGSGAKGQNTGPLGHPRGSDGARVRHEFEKRVQRYGCLSRASYRVEQVANLCHYVLHLNPRTGILSDIDSMTMSAPMPE